MKLKLIAVVFFCSLLFNTAIYANNPAEISIQGFDPVDNAQQQEDLNALRLIQKAAADNARELFHQSGDPVAGNLDGQVTLVIFFDYRCPHCVTLDPLVQSIMHSNPDLRIVYKEFPIRGPLATYCAKAALAANQQGKYLPFHVALMQHAYGLTEDKVLAIAQSLGLDIEKLKSDMNSSTIEEKINSTYQLAQTVGVNGTPALFVAKTYLPSNAASSIAFFPGEVGQAELQRTITKLK